MAEYILIWGEEIVYRGTKRACMERYNLFKDPWPMELIKVESKEKVFK